MTFSAFQPLSDACRYLSEKDVDFASSLQRGFMQYGRFTDKQQHWVNVLLERAEKAKQPKEERPNHERLNLAPVHAMFDKAKASGLKRVKMGFLDQEGRRFVVSLAPEAGANAGHLYVKSRDDGYLGKITPDGEFKGAFNVPGGQVMMAQAALVKFCAEDPVKAAKVYGQETGTCMFCLAELTDGRSKAMSYGPICAERYGLPWGEEGRPATKRARKA